MQNINPEENQKYLEALFARNRYLYKEKKLIPKKEYVSNNVKILNKMSSMLCKEYEIQLIMEALLYEGNLLKFRLAINSLRLSIN